MTLTTCMDIYYLKRWMDKIEMYRTGVLIGVTKCCGIQLVPKNKY